MPVYQCDNCGEIIDPDKDIHLVISEAGQNRVYLTSCCNAGYHELYWYDKGFKEDGMTEDEVIIAAMNACDELSAALTELSRTLLTYLKG